MPDDSLARALDDDCERAAAWAARRVAAIDATAGLVPVVAVELHATRRTLGVIAELLGALVDAQRARLP